MYVKEKEERVLEIPWKKIIYAKLSSNERRRVRENIYPFIVKITSN